LRSLALARNPGLAIPDEIGDLLSLEALYLDESELEAVPDAHLRDLAVDRFLVLAVVLLLLVFLRDSAAQIATTGRGVSVIGPPASVALAAEVAQRRMCPYALLTIPAIAIEESGVGQPWHTIASIFDSIVWTAFFADAALMLNGEGAGAGVAAEAAQVVGAGPRTRERDGSMRYGYEACWRRPPQPASGTAAAGPCAGR
jgi:hypothetical protein